jgi:transcription antitermination factor NusG
MISSGLSRSSRGVQAGETLPWYACYTRGKHENKVASHLDSRGIETFLPVHRQHVQWSDRRKTVERPLFPSYVFARCPSSELPQLLSTRGLVTLLRTGGKLAVIPDEEIENLRRFTEVINDCGIVPEREPAIQAGDRVRVVTGPFTGIEGVAVMRRGRRRLLVALTTVADALVVDLDGASLLVIGAGAPGSPA